MVSMLSTILPILIFLGFGLHCRKSRLLSEDGVDSMKNVSIRFLWPIVLFYAFFTATYNFSTVVYAGTVFVLLTVMFFIGRVLRKTVGGEERAFCLPYLLVGSEIGMLGYSLYMLLFGAESVSHLALFDVGHAMFIFPIFLGCLNIEQGEGTVKQALADLIRTPLIIMLVIGLACGISGLGNMVMSSAAGEIINGIYSLVSSANVVIMLTAMGYGLSFSAKDLRDSFRFILARMIAMIICTVCGLLFIKAVVGLTPYTMYGLIMVFMMPPVYMLAVYVKDRKDNEFMTTVTSIYTLLSIIAFIIMTIIIR